MYTATRSILRRLMRLEDRLVPAEVLHSLFPDASGPQGGARFGEAVATGSQYRVVAAPHTTVANLVEVGQVFVYDSATNNLVATINDPTPVANENFGLAVAVAGNFVVIGDVNGDTGANNAGSVYIFDMNSMTPTVPIFTLNNPTPAASDNFGNSVSISGNIVVVAAASDNTAANNAGSAYVYDLTSMTPTTPIYTLNNPSPASNDFFGSSVSVSGKYVVVGVFGDDTGASSAGLAYVYDLTSGTPTVPVATLLNPSPALGDLFGNSVAVSGNYVVVGAWQDDTGNFDAGSAYVYDMSSMTPTTPIATLNNPTPDGFEAFGYSVAASAARIIVGARFDGTGALNAGSAYVYDMNSMTPTTPIATLNNPSAAQDDEFGYSVAIWGNEALIGAHRDDTGGGDTGSAYVFDVTSMTPTVPTATLLNPTVSINDNFGYALAASENLVVVGAFRDATGATNAGAAYVFDLNSPTPTVPIHVLYNPSPEVLDWFGYSVAVSGNYVVVGAHYDDTGANDSGAAYVYDLNSMTPTVPFVTLNNPAPSSDDQFGWDVAVSGKYVVVGAIMEDVGANDTGAAYVYDLTAMTPAIPVVTLNNPNPGSSDNFGNSVAMSGNFVVVGAYRDNGGSAVGSAYVYDLNSMTPTVPTATLNNPTPMDSDVFGSAVAISGHWVVVGAPSDDTGAGNAGSAYVYDLNSMTPTVPLHTINNPTPLDDESFGISLDISGDMLVVGAAYAKDGAIIPGEAYVFDLGSMTPTIPMDTIASPLLADGVQLGYAVAVAGDNIVVGAPFDYTQNYAQGAAHVVTFAPPQVAQVQINDGASQRSRVTSIAVTFDQPVTFSGTPTDAFSLVRQSDTMAVTLNVSQAGNTVTLSFIGGPLDFGSLADGRYTLTIDASQVSNSNGPLDGNGDGAPADDFELIGSPVNGLFRLFGDADGDGAVTALDFNAFRLQFGTIGLSIFDFDNDGQVSAADFNQFRLRYGMMVGP